MGEVNESYLCAHPKTRDPVIEAGAIPILSMLPLLVSYSKDIQFLAQPIAGPLIRIAGGAGVCLLPLLESPEKNRECLWHDHLWRVIS